MAFFLRHRAAVICVLVIECYLLDKAHSLIWYCIDHACFRSVLWLLPWLHDCNAWSWHHCFLERLKQMSSQLTLAWIVETCHVSLFMRLHVCMLLGHRLCHNRWGKVSAYNSGFPVSPKRYNWCQCCWVTCLHVPAAAALLQETVPDPGQWDADVHRRPTRGAWHCICAF